MGHNVQDSDEIRQLRRQLGHAEHFYHAEDHGLKAEMARLKYILEHNERELEDERGRRKQLEEQMEQRKRELAAVKQMHEENVKELEELYEQKKIVDSRSTKRDIFEFYMNARRGGGSEGTEVITEEDDGSREDSVV